MRPKLTPRRVAFGAGVIVIAASVIFAAWLGTKAAGNAMSGHAMFALFLGVVLSIAVSMGLFALVFHSARSGHDDAAHWSDED